ncbi:MAG: autotransporter assembly complex family protein [Gammaproteobacteria bacterium]|jgi:translocation and assembly module TamA
MLNSCRALLILASILYSTALWAQTEVEIEILGIDEKLEENVRLFLSLEQQKDHPLMSEGRVRRLHLRAADEIAAALHPYGFYRPRIESSLEQSEDGVWRASYRIDPGPAIPIAMAEIRVSSPMAEEPELQELLESESPRVGEKFSHVAYDKFKADLSRLAAEEGYFRARFVEHRVEIDLNAYEARIFLEYESGPRFRFGEISMAQDVIEVELLSRYLNFQRGDPYSLDKLVDLQLALNNSEYFQTVEVTSGEISPDSDEVPVQVKLTPRNRHRYEFGVGYGTDTGARARFGWRMPRINTRGHKLDSQLRLAESGNSANINYRVPGEDPRRDQIVYTAGIYNEEFEDTDSNLREVGVRYIHGRGEWRETLSLTYQREDYTVGDIDDTSNLLIPGVAWTRIWGRDFINVLDGLRFDLALTGADENFASDIDFSQVTAGLKFITSFGPRDRIIARGGAGGTETPDFDQLPASLRFYTGGSQTVRGYKYNSLGPTNDDGEVIGARYLLFGGIDYEHYFNDRWGMALFIDAGNAIDSFDDDLEQGAGFGLRWKSPIGPVRIDLANAISDEDRPWRLHVNIGPDL